MTADAERPADVLGATHLAFGDTELADLERRMQGILDPDDAIDAAFTALDWLAHALPAADLAIVPADSDHMADAEVRCPACGAVVRARMADVPTGEVREEWCVRRPDGALVRDSFTREQAEDVIFYEETTTGGIRGCELMRRTVHTGPWLPAGTEEP